jgi:hypothetical protein
MACCNIAESPARPRGEPTHLRDVELISTAMHRAGLLTE